MVHNLLLDTDSYKTSHYKQFPPGTSRMLCYGESRGGKYKDVIFFGLQYIVNKYLTQPISYQDVAEADEFWTSHGVPFPREEWEHVVFKHSGYIPVEIKSVEEGFRVPCRCALYTVQSTCPQVFWVAGWIETMLSRVWYPTTVATMSWHCKDMLSHFLLDTTGNLDGLDFMLHDFGSRGATSRESASLGGAGHLISFQGTDNGVALKLIRDFYAERMAGYSIPAMEHSTVTAWGREGESAAYRNMLTQYAKPGATLACVSDSYDIDYACDEIWGQELREYVINSGARVVIRPDSGDPVSVVMRVLQILGNRFGVTQPYRGYKLLNHVRVLQGDGVNPRSMKLILDTIQACGWSAGNIAFGMGGALLQQCDRDTLSFAYKCCEISVGNEIRPVLKLPKGDTTKRSYRGFIDTVRYEDGTIASLDRRLAGWGIPSIMKVRYRNGEVFNKTTFKQIRERAQ